MSVALTAEIERDWTKDAILVVLKIGDQPIRTWDVTRRRDEIEQQPGDYWGAKETEEHENAFVAKFLAPRLALMFRRGTGLTELTWSWKET